MTKLPVLTRTALAVALAGSIGLAAMPASFAQDAAPAKPAAQQLQHPGQWRAHHFRGNPDRGNGRAGLMEMLASPRGAEALEIAFVRLSHRVDLTDAQKPAFEDLKATALKAQASFADAAKAARQSVKPAEGQRPDLVAALKARLVIDTARLEAMNTVMPKLETFLNGLTDTQKAALMPQRDHVGWQQKRPGGNGHFQHGRNRANPGAMQVNPADENNPAGKSTT